MVFLQYLHFPFKHKNDIIGIKSVIDNLCLQLQQIERIPVSLMSLSVLNKR